MSDWSLKYKELTEEQYRKAPGVNKSTLWELRRSPAHYKYALEHPTKDTPALKFGRALHSAILQPLAFEDEYAITPDIDRRTKDGKAAYEWFMQQNAGRTLLTVDEYETISEMREAVLNDKNAYELLCDCLAEIPLFWTDESTRIRCKCRFDAVKQGVIVDLKTCQDASTDRFMKDALRFGYDVQAAHYIRGYRSQHDETPEFWFLAIEKTPPYAINLIKAGDAFIDRGTMQLIDLMDKLAYCRKHRSWGGYGKNELVLPEWATIPDDID